MRGAQRLLESTIKARRALSRSKPPMIAPRQAVQSWYRADPNVGDLLSPLIAEATFGVTTRWVSHRFQGKLLGLGSIANRVQESDLLVGCGSIQEQEITLPATARVAWLRGPLTRRCLGSRRIPEVYGDPGILVSEVIPIRAEKSGAIGVIPHYVDHQLARAARLHEDVKLIDVQEPVLHFLESLCSCEIVLSSSLHGIVLAESYGIPALWLTPHSDMKGGRFKFHDYYLGTDRPIPADLSLEAGLEIARSGDFRPVALEVSDLRLAIAEVRQELAGQLG